MENTITRYRNDDVKVSISENVLSALCRYMPKGCPFENYTLKDLLCDWIKSYDWMIEVVGNKTVLPIISFVRMLQDEHNIYALTYGNVIINIIMEKSK